MKRTIIAMLLIVSPIIALAQVPDHDAEMKKIRAEIREMLVWRETVIREQIRYQLDEIRNQLFIERMFPDVYMPRLYEPLYLAPLFIPDLFTPFIEE